MEVVGGDGGVEFEGRYLGEGVDAGVGTSGALREDGLACDQKDSFGQGSLDGGESGLNLPAVKRGAIVSEGNLPAGHRKQVIGQKAVSP
jgi:hypothetical protein